MLSRTKNGRQKIGLIKLLFALSMTGRGGLGMCFSCVIVDVVVVYKAVEKFSLRKSESFAS